MRNKQKPLPFILSFHPVYPNFNEIRNKNKKLKLIFFIHRLDKMFTRNHL